MTNQELEEISGEGNFSWIKVKKLNIHDTKDIFEAFDTLEKHHKEETGFLISKCQELAKEVIELRDKYYGGMEDAG